MFTLETVMWILLAGVSNSGHTGLNHPRQSPRSPNHPSLRVVSRERDSTMHRHRTDPRHVRQPQPTNRGPQPVAWPLAAPGAPVDVLSCPELVLPRSAHSGVVQGQIELWGVERGTQQLIMNEHLVIL